MKHIKELNFENIVLIEKYLSDKLSEKEISRFERNLIFDRSLRDDFRMVAKLYKNDYKKLARVKDKHFNVDRDLQMAFLRKKIGIGRQIIGYGVSAVAFALVLVLICGVIISLLS